MKKITKKPNIIITKKTKIIVLVAGLLLGLGMYLKSIMVAPKVAEVGNTAVSSCQTNITSISFHDECALQGTFKRSVYTCSDGATAEKFTSLNCVSYEEILKEAQNNCGQTCIVASVRPTPTPTPVPTPVYSTKPSVAPTPTPTPYPTSTPQQGMNFSCNVKVYQLQPGDNPSADPSIYATPNRLVNASQTRVTPGQHFALLIEETSNSTISVSTVSASTENVSGSREPIKVTATTPYCKSTDSWGKYMGCTHPSTTFTANTPKTLKIGMTIQIQDNIYEMAKTSIRFGLYNILSGSGYKSDCYVTLQAAEASKPLPTLVPSPSVVATPTPRPTKIPFAQCYRSCRSERKGMLGCLNRCLR